MPAEELEWPVPFGIDAETGDPLPGIDEAAVDAFISNDREPVPDAALQSKCDPKKNEHFGVTSEYDPAELDQVGWAVMFAPSITKEMREALAPLIEHRRKQVGDKNEFIKVETYEGESCCGPKESAEDWLRRQPKHPRLDTVDPMNGVPYYILLVGPPDEIPFEFQYSLDLYWAVGRLHFSTADEYRNYAESVIAYETMPKPPGTRQMAIFAPRNDGATFLSHDFMAQPMAVATEGSRPLGTTTKFKLQPYLGTAATKNTLGDIFNGRGENGRPALLFTATHGMSYKPDNPAQAERQGALLCQDWPGTGGTNPNQYFQAADLGSSPDVHGLIHFLFACYGGGCPEFDDFSQGVSSVPRLAQKPFFARLPQSLLGREGGALAVLAHVDRAWASSFKANQASQAHNFRDVFTEVMKGTRIGHATDRFNLRWSTVSASLLQVIQDKDFGYDPKQVADLWVVRNDARNYIVMGDPAVRIREKELPPIQ